MIRYEYIVGEYHYMSEEEAFFNMMLNKKKGLKGESVRAYRLSFEGNFFLKKEEVGFQVNVLKIENLS